MKITKFLALVVASLTIASCSQGFKTKSSLNSEIDSVSYALGLNMASQLKTNFEEVDNDLFVQGFKNGLDSTNLLIPQKDVKMTLNSFFQKKQQEKMKERQETQKKQAAEKFADWKKENEAFLEANKSKTGVKTTSSGLQYIVVKEGKGESPKATDKIEIHYRGSNIKGAEFDSSYKRGKPYAATANQFVKGFSEALLLMKPGAKYKIFIPQELGYGFQQRGAEIKPFSTLIFDLELLKVKK